MHKHISSYVNEGIYPFHMPGHKRNKYFLPSELLTLDVTELSLAETDDLHKPEGIIKKSQEKAAQLFGSQETLFLVNGSTVGILASVLSIITAQGDKLLLARTCHKSAYNALVLSGGTPVYVYPMEAAPGITGCVTKEDIQERLSADPDIKAVLLVSPTYEGLVSDIEGIASVVHSFDKILIVDEAHGAHFPFNPAFPKPALHCGADIVINSLHKTLPALGQTALLHINGNRVNSSLLKLNLQMLQTSSPSYVLLSSISACLDFLEDRELFALFAERLLRLRASLKSAEKIKLIEKKDLTAVFDLDISKLVFLTNSLGISTEEVEKLLAVNYKLQMELRGISHIVALTSVADTEDGFNRLSHAILDIDSTNFNQQNHSHTIQYNPLSLTQVLTPRAAYLLSHKSRLVPLEEANGFIAAETIIPYPPGVPLVVMGEVFTAEALKAVRRFLKNNIFVYGITFIKNKEFLKVLVLEVKDD